MPWQTPKTNWAAGDVPAADDFNRIEENINYIEQEDRTPDQSVTPVASGPLQSILNFFAALLKSVTGKANWYELPAKSLEQLNSDLIAHQADKANPHNVTAAQVGALSSIDGVSNAGGDVDLVAGANISITPDNTNKNITISGMGTWPNADTVDNIHFRIYNGVLQYDDGTGWKNMGNTVTVQRGVSSVGADATVNVTISSVDVSKSFVSISATTGGGATEKAPGAMVRARLIDSTTLELWNDDGKWDVSVAWEVIEIV